jgi:hypothetical protein
MKVCSSPAGHSRRFDFAGLADFQPVAQRDAWSRRFFLVQVGCKKTDDIVMAERFGPRDEGTVPSHLIMLNGLSRAY